jgi:tetratricopeptide (TPR) repeat protein
MSRRKNITATASPAGEGWPARDGWIALGLFAALLMLYYPAIHGTPIWDDENHLTRAEIQSWHGLYRIWFDLSATQQYYPVTHSVFWVEHRLWGDWYPGYHLVNILLHGTSAVLLVRVLRRLEAPGAWLAAALWALHPIEVESVAWMSELKNTLSGTCCLGAALLYLRFDRERSWRVYLAAAGLFFAGLLAKSVIVTLPAALLLMFYWERGKVEWRRDVLPLVPLFAIGIGSGLFTAWVERTYIGASGNDFHFSLLGRVLIAGRVFWFYLGKLIWPDLEFSYPRWQISVAVWWQYVYPIFALGLIGWLAAMRGRWGRGPLVAVLYYGVTLFPALGFVNVYPFRFSFVADHFQYLAGIGPMVLVAAGIARLHTRAGKEWAVAAPCVCGIWLATLGFLTWMQAAIYTDVETLWHATLAKNPDSALAYDNLAELLAKQGRYEDAVAEYQNAIRVEPNCVYACNGLGDLEYRMRRPADAIAAYRASLTGNPEQGDVHGQIGLCLLLEGRLDEAIAEYREAIRLMPSLMAAYDNLGDALYRAGRVGEASDEYREAIRVNPGFATPYYNLGVVQYAQGDTGEAIANIEKSLALDPSNATAAGKLAWILAAAPQTALRNGARAVDLASKVSDAEGGSDPVILRTLAAAYAQEGEFSQAVRVARKALELSDARKIKVLSEALRREMGLYQAGQSYRYSP